MKTSLFSNLVPCLLAAALLVSIPPAHASMVAVSNLGNTVDAYHLVNDLQVGANRVGQDLANSFTAGSTVMLDSIRVNFAGGYDPTGTGFSAALYSDAGGTAPGTLLATLTGPDPHGGGLYSYIPTTQTQLSSGVTYWAVFSAVYGAPDKEFPITVTVDPSETGLPGWSIGNYTQLDTRTVTNGVPGAWSPQAVGGVLQFEVNTSAVPEPSRMLLLASGFGAMFWTRRRRKAAGA
jgi:hypothetical protein